MISGVLARFARVNLGPQGNHIRLKRAHPGPEGLFESKLNQNRLVFFFGEGFSPLDQGPFYDY